MAPDDNGYRHRSEARQRLMSQLADELLAQWRANQKPERPRQTNVIPGNDDPELPERQRKAEVSGIAAELIRRLSIRDRNGRDE